MRDLYLKVRIATPSKEFSSSQIGIPNKVCGDPDTLRNHVKEFLISTRRFSTSASESGALIVRYINMAIKNLNLRLLAGALVTCR